MGNLLSGLFNFVGGAVNSLLGGNAARKDQQNYNLENMGIQQQFAEKNMAIQNKYNVEAFNAENAYNDPLSQRQRLERAGINPNWTDGASTAIGQMDSGTPASSPTGGMPSAGNTNFLGDLFNIIQLGKDLKLKDKQIQNIQADTRLKNSEANVKNERLPWDIENIKASTSKLLSDTCKTQQEADYYSTYLDKMFQHWEYENMSLDEQIKMARERLPYDLKFTDSQTRQAVEQAAYLHVLSKYKPVEVANDTKRVGIEQQNANTNSRNAEINQQNANTNSFNAITGRLDVQEKIRNNKEVNSLTRAYNNVLAQESRSRRAKLDKESYFQDLQNTLTHELRKSGVDVAIQNATLWKLIADKEYIQAEKQKLGQDIELFEDAYFGKLYNEYLPHFFK